MAERVPGWWPLLEHSQHLRVGSIDWHLQRLPGPTRGAPLALLLHGTGASGHSWRHLAPLLARHYEVIAPDLPGHAFTHSPSSQALSLPAVAEALAECLRSTHCRPALVVGHSAGAAIALRMVLDGSIVPQQLVSINGAILPLQGPLGRMFLPAARLLVINPLVPHVFSAFARMPTMARRLLDGTGSRIDALGERCYAELISRPSHAAGALRLMASWDLEPLANELPRLQVPLLLLAGEADRTLPASHSRRVRAQVPHARLHTLPGLGHLAHEEDATAVWHHIHAAGAESRVGSDRGAGWSPPASHRA